nr:MAG TPA: hypothetical protein [Caudoviricetes sp.]
MCYFTHNEQSTWPLLTTLLLTSKASDTPLLLDICL